jgi:hypothetical protein
MHINVRGIDRDGNSQEMAAETHREPKALARDLCNRGWKYAKLEVNGEKVAEVAAVAVAPHRVKRVWK